MDVTPTIPEGRQIIESYGDGGFRVSGTRFEGSVIVFPERTVPWPVTEIGDIDEAAMSAVIAAAETTDILLLGCGARIEFVPKALREMMKERAGVVIDAMDTGAAARTYNVLMAEERRVAAALIATR